MLRIGFVGLDSSHCTAFTDLLRSGQSDLATEQVRVVAGWTGGSADFPLSISRAARFTEQMRERGVQIYPTPADVLENSDAIILGAVDGRCHLELARQLFPAGLPIFVDKPLAHNRDAALQIAQLGERCGTRWFTASALRYQQSLLGALESAADDKVISCDCYGTVKVMPGHLELAWYGVHGIEAIYSVLGQGCQEVRRVRTERGDVITGIWHDGRIGTFRGLHEGEQAAGFGMVIGRQQSVVPLQFPADYGGLVDEIVKFFRGGEVPVTAAESLEIFAFMQAAEESGRQQGRPVLLRDCLAAE